jgi:hypothetical protein
MSFEMIPIVEDKIRPYIGRPIGIIMRNDVFTMEP